MRSACSCTCCSAASIRPAPPSDRPPTSCGRSSTRSPGGCPTPWSAERETPGGARASCRRVRHDAGQAAPEAARGSRHHRRQGAEEERAGALRVGHGAGGRSSALSASRADQRAAGHAAVSDRHVRAAARARRGGDRGGRPAARRLDRFLYDPARDRARPRAAGGGQGRQGERAADRAADRRRSLLRPRRHGENRPFEGCSTPAPSGCRKSSSDSPSCRPRC